MSKLLTLHETAERLRVSYITIKRWAAAGRFPVIRLSPQVVRVKEEDLEAMLEGASASGAGE
jgi:excisionase family DNA binding protein